MSKRYLNIQQMRTLAQMGLSLDMAAEMFRRIEPEWDYSRSMSLYRSGVISVLSFPVAPILTVHDMLRLLPHVVNEKHPDGATRQYFLEISYHEKRVGYSYPEFLSTEMNFTSTLIEYHDREEFLDALYKMLCWVLSGTDYLKRPSDDRTVVKTIHDKC